MRPAFLLHMSILESRLVPGSSAMRYITSRSARATDHRDIDYRGRLHRSTLPPCKAGGGLVALAGHAGGRPGGRRQAAAVWSRRALSLVQKSPCNSSFFTSHTGALEAEDHPGLFCTRLPGFMLPLPDSTTGREAQKQQTPLSHLQQTIQSFIRHAQKAARDPDVISIKMTSKSHGRGNGRRPRWNAAGKRQKVVALVELASPL